MRVRMLVDMHGTRSYMAGETYEVSDGEGQRLCEKGFAQPAGGPSAPKKKATKKKAPAKPEPDPEATEESTATDAA